ncbi:MAG: hypothetical protein L0Y71_14820 [Gemmataceae bacterium]|nr:hypothetical protein [Gemmataceae bacterium]
MPAVQLDPAAWKKNAPASIKTGEVHKALEELAKAKTNLKKEKDPANFFKALEKIAKTAVAKDEQTAKKQNDKEALKALAEIKKAAEAGRGDTEELLLTGDEGDSTNPSGQSGIPVPEVRGGGDAMAMSDRSGEGGSGGGAAAAVTTIVNTLKEAWAIVKDNAPDATAETTYCQAMPEKSQLAWEELYGWKKAADKWSFQYKTKFYRTFGFGPTVDIDFELGYLWGGRSDKAPGLFLNNYTVWCKSIDVPWGWTVHVDAKTGGKPFNSGSRDKPVGAIELRVSVKYGTKLTSKSKAWAITCAGDGSRQVS